MIKQNSRLSSFVIRTLRGREIIVECKCACGVVITTTVNECPAATISISRDCHCFVILWLFIQRKTFIFVSTCSVMEERIMRSSAQTPHEVQIKDALAKLATPPHETDSKAINQSFERLFLVHCALISRAMQILVQLLIKIYCSFSFPQR